MFCFYMWSAAQIILESFPISSSGHLALVNAVCPVQTDVPFFAFLQDYFAYLLHLPTALVVALFFVQQWSFPFMHIKRCWRLIVKIALYTALATVVTVLGYGIFLLIPKTIIPLPVAFILTALFLLSLRWCPATTDAKLDSLKVVILGFVQALAFMPGISRFAATYAAARWMGIRAQRALEISLLIQWPLIVCASLYSFYVLPIGSIELLNLTFLLVMIGASMVAYVGLSIMLYMVKEDIVWWWGWYMLIPFSLSVMWGVMHA